MLDRYSKLGKIHWIRLLWIFKSRSHKTTAVIQDPPELLSPRSPHQTRWEVSGSHTVQDPRGEAASQQLHGDCSSVTRNTLPSPRHRGQRQREQREGQGGWHGQGQQAAPGHCGHRTATVVFTCSKHATPSTHPQLPVLKTRAGGRKKERRKKRDKQGVFGLKKKQISFATKESNLK